MSHFALIAMLLAGFANVEAAGPLVDVAEEEYQILVVESGLSLQQASQSAVQAGKVLGVEPQCDTLTRPRSVPHLEGVSVYKSEDGRYAVSAYATTWKDEVTEKRFASIAQKFPKARRVTLRSREGSFYAGERLYVVVLGSEKSHAEAVDLAQKLSTSLKVKFVANFSNESTMLINPARRDNDACGKTPYCLSVDLASIYHGFASVYSVIGGVYTDEDEAKKTLKHYKKQVPDTYFRCVTYHPWPKGN